MLVILSDLHLNDGTCGALLAPGTMNLLSERLCDLAWRASWRADGSYQPIQRLDMVLLGDVLDITGSQRWLKGDARPWSDVTTHAVSDTAAANCSGPGGSGPNSGGRAACNCANTGLPSRARIFTGTGPAPSSNTMRVSSPVSAMSPIAANTKAVPTVG